MPDKTVSRRSVEGCRQPGAANGRPDGDPVAATSGHPIGQEIGARMTGLKVQRAHDYGRSNTTALQSSRPTSCSAGRDPKRAVRPQFDKPNWRCRPSAADDRDGVDVGDAAESCRSPQDRFGEPEPQRSGAGQRSVVWAGNRPTPADRRAPNLSDDRPGSFMFRIYEAAVRGHRQSATCCLSRRRVGCQQWP